MAIFWNNNKKKIRSDAKNLFSDKRYKKNGSKISGDDQISKLLADLYNTFLKK